MSWMAWESPLRGSGAADGVAMERWKRGGPPGAPPRRLARRKTPLVLVLNWACPDAIPPAHFFAARAEKAKNEFPRPTAGALRPVVRGQTVKYNSKRRAGRGFTLEELKEAGIPTKLAPTIGVAVDHRRKNRSLEGLQENVNRLKAYKANLVVFPRRANKPKAGDASAEELKTAAQLKGALLPITKTAPVLEKVAITDAMRAEKAYATLRLERMNARLIGVRAKRAADAAAAEKE